MWASRCRHCAIVFLAALLAVPLGAQEKKEQPKEEDPIVVIPFQETDVGLHTCAAIAMLSEVVPSPQMQLFGVVGVRILGSSENVPLIKWQFRFDEVLPLPHELLDETKDGLPLPSVLYKEYKKLKGFYPLLCKAVEKTHGANLDQFKTSAAANEHVTYADLKATPGRYRGKVITVKGKLKVLRKADTPRLVADDIKAELPQVYTGLIRGPIKNAPPFTFVITELPPEIPGPGENLDRDVTFHGYFLAFVDYPPDKDRGAEKDIVSPYLVGKTLIVEGPGRVTDEPATSAWLIAIILGSIVTLGLLLVLVGFWLRRGDRRVQSQLAEVRDRQNPFNIEPAEEEPKTPPENRDPGQAPG